MDFALVQTGPPLPGRNGGAAPLLVVRLQQPQHVASLPRPALLRALAHLRCPPGPSWTLPDPPVPPVPSRTLDIFNCVSKKIYFLSNIEVLEDNVDEREPDTGPAAAKDGTEVNQNEGNSRYKRTSTGLYRSCAALACFSGTFDLINISSS